MTIQLVLFDMDGVIFEGKNFWLDLHEAYGTVEEGLELADKYLISDYDLLARTVAEQLWKDRPVSVYWNLIKARVYQPCIQEVFEHLHKQRIQTALISSGPYHLALRAQKDLGIDEIWANKLLMRAGYFQGQVEVMVSDSDKGRIGTEIMRKRGVKAGNISFIGDSESDVGLAKLVGLPVAYDSVSDRLIAVCKYVLRHGELYRLLEILH